MALGSRECRVIGGECQGMPVPWEIIAVSCSIFSNRTILKEITKKTVMDDDDNGGGDGEKP